MNRKHDIKFYYLIIEKLKKINPNIDISSDFIIGYPGETDKDFNKTMELIKNIGFVNSYSFIFSPRPGTPASKLKQINYKMAQKRLKIVQDELFKFQKSKNKSLVGSVVEVLVENKLKDQDKFFGRNSKTTSVIFTADACKPGDLIKVKIISSNQNNLFGEGIEKKTKAA